MKGTNIPFKQLCNDVLSNVPGIPGCLGRFDLKKGGGQMKKGAITGSISHIETRFRRSPPVDSSHPT